MILAINFVLHCKRKKLIIICCIIIFNEIGLRPMILLVALVMILFAYAHNYIKLNHHFCVSKNIICFSKYHYEVISLNH